MKQEFALHGLCRIRIICGSKFSAHNPKQPSQELDQYLGNLHPTDRHANHSRPPGPSHKRPCAVAIGNFDGVHLGHQRLLRAVTKEAHARGLASAVVTFEPHPRELFGKEPFARISTLRDKMIAIAGCGIDAVYIMPFHKRFAALSPEASFATFFSKASVAAG